MGAAVPPVTVREARHDELAAAGNVVVEAYLTLPGTRHDAYLDHIRDTAGRARHCTILVAVDATGRIMGSVTYVPGPANPFAETERDGEAGFRMLGVSPEARGQGVGQALVAACLDRARGAGRRAVAITSTPEMAAAHRLYQRMGFVRDPARDFDPLPGVHLLGFVHDLEAAPPAGPSLAPGATG